MTKKPLKKLKQNALQRRLSVAVAGATSGARLITSHAGSMFKPQEAKDEIRRTALAREAASFADTLGELKGAYVKIGQLMALYGDHLLPAEITNELRNLESHTEAMDWRSIEPVLQEQLGDSFNRLAIEQKPIAAASLSQVHRAVDTQTKQELCLKVQYPGVANTIESDFQTMLNMLKIARWVPRGREFEEWMQEIKQMLVDEVDYQREVAMTNTVAGLVKGDSRFLVPKVMEGCSTNSVITMEFMSGYVVTDNRIQRMSLARRNQLAGTMLENFFSEIFTWGIMQTDPNFGNYRVQPRTDKNDNDKIVLLDFGAVRPLPDAFRQALCDTILAAHKANHQAVIKGAIALGCLHPDQNKSVKESFADFCILLMEPFKRDHSETPAHALNDKGQYDWYSSRLLKRVGKLGAKAIITEGFSSPPKEFALIARKLTGVFSFITALKAEFNAAPLIEPYLKGSRQSGE